MSIRILDGAEADALMLKRTSRAETEVVKLFPQRRTRWRLGRASPPR